jgi:hypothetical protein
MTQTIYDYIVENMNNYKKNICLCEVDECCYKCCAHTVTTCVWKNYVESNEWNDPDNVWFGSLKGISY